MARRDEKVLAKALIRGATGIEIISYEGRCNGNEVFSINLREENGMKKLRMLGDTYIQRTPFCTCSNISQY